MIAFSTVCNVRDNRPHPDAFAGRLAAFADYLEAEAAIVGTDKLNTLCLSPAIYDDGVIRAKRRVAGWNWFTADIDNKEANEPHSTIEAIAELCTVMGVPFVIYTTSSHTAQAHRFRLMLPLDRVVEPAEFAEFWGCMAAWLGCLDPATKDESRLFVAPRRWSEAQFYRSDEGQPLSVDLIKMAHPVTVPVRPRKSVTSAFASVEGLKDVCPTEVSLSGDFVTPQSLARASGGAPGTRMFPFLIRSGVRALLKGYAITPDHLATIGYEFAQSIGRKTEDIDHDAVNAYTAALSRYAEAKANDLERLNPHQRFLDKWKH